MSEETYENDQLVYVDPDKRLVVDIVEWLPNGKVKQLEMPPREEVSFDDEEKKDAKPRRKRKPKVRYYPWCSYRTAKKVYRVAGKEKEAEEHQPFDDVLKKALSEPFWD